MSEIKDRINFMVHDGFPFDQNTFDKLQTALLSAEKLGWLGLNADSGHTAFKVVGAAEALGVADDGWIFLNGNIYPLAGGTVKDFIQLHFVNEQEVFNDGMGTSNENKYTTQQFVFMDALAVGNPAYGDGIAWAEVLTLPRLEELIPFNEVTTVAHGDYTAPWDALNENDVTYFGEKCFVNGALRRVNFSGSIINASSIHVGDVIFTLPAGFKPNEDKFFPCHYDGEVRFIKIATNGDVIWANADETIAEHLEFGTITYLAYN